MEAQYFFFLGVGDAIACWLWWRGWRKVWGSESWVGEDGIWWPWPSRESLLKKLPFSWKVLVLCCLSSIIQITPHSIGISTVDSLQRGFSLSWQLLQWPNNVSYWLLTLPACRRSVLTTLTMNFSCSLSSSPVRPLLVACLSLIS